MSVQKVGHVLRHAIRVVEVHVVVAGHHVDGDVGPARVEVVRVLEVRGVPCAVAVGQHEHDRAHGVGEHAPMLVERHDRVER